MNSRLVSAIRIATGLLFFQHGAEKLWGFASGQIDHNFLTLHGFAGPLEVVGGALIVFGLFTRLAAFILCGQMAVAYFDQWAWRSFFPISNGGEEAVIFCFVYLWLVAAGPGPWSVDASLGWEAKLARGLDRWEPLARGIARIVLAFMLSLHGYRGVFGWLAKSAGRAAVIPLAIDKMPAWAGWVEVGGGLLLAVGLFTRVSAIVVCLELAAAYVLAAMPRGAWPIHNGGNETLMYLVFFGFSVACGAGSFSLDAFWKGHRQPRGVLANAARGY
ncbi:MAG TPA: DoxX family protein [Bryobacteraceae bacterium]|nr:DoxX family protein [Bryobacteraceae bacterium]